MTSEGKSTETMIHEFLGGIKEAIEKKIRLNGNVFGSSQII